MRVFLAVMVAAGVIAVGSVAHLLHPWSAFAVAGLTLLGVGFVVGIGTAHAGVRRDCEREELMARGHLARVLDAYGVNVRPWDDDLMDVADAVAEARRRRPEP